MRAQANPSRGPLAGIVVADLTSYLSGPLCTMLLADQGAEVIKVEHPSNGDEARRFAPFVNGMSAAFMTLNRNKRGLTLDLKDPSDLEALRRLLIQADVMVENFRPGVCDRLGIGKDEVQKANPRLVYASISGFGQTGPYRDRGGFDMIAQGMSGLMSINALPDGTPCRLPIPVSDICAGMLTAQAISAALLARERTGEGQSIDVSLLDVAISLGVYEAASYLATGEVPASIGPGHRTSAPYQVFRAKDGFLTLGAGAQALWLKLCKVLHATHLSTDSRFAEPVSRVRHREVLAQEIEKCLAARCRDDWIKDLLEAGIPAGPVSGYDEVFRDPQVLDRELVASVEHPQAGATRLVGAVARFDGTPCSIDRHAPDLGEHTADICAQYRLRH